MARVDSDDKEQPPTSISHSLMINESGLVKLFVYGCKVNFVECLAFESSPVEPCNVNFANFPVFLKFIDSIGICTGSPEAEFLELAAKKKRGFRNKAGGYVVTVVNRPVKLNGRSYERTVCLTKCQILTKREGRRCKECKLLRKKLHIYRARWQLVDAAANKFTRNTVLTTPQRQGKLRKLAKNAVVQRQKIRRLKERIQSWVEKSSVTVDENLSDEISHQLDTKSDDALASFPTGSFQRLFWEEQQKASRCRGASGRRWHPLMIRWAMSLKLQSSTAYHHVRTSGFVVLPSERTLHDYIHFYNVGCGFHTDLNNELSAHIAKANINGHEKFVVLSFDEMRIREDLVYDKNSCNVIGFVNLGEVNNQLKRLEKSVDNLPGRVPIATHMLVFMIRGILSSFRFPYGHFLTTEITADYLFDIVWTAIRHIESLGLHVVAVTCDGSSTNRKFYRMHDSAEGCDSPNSPLYKTVNPYSDDRLPLYFICDVPHLIKTTRNCWSHSFPGSKRRAMWFNEKSITWSHLTELHRKHQEIPDAAGLYLVKKKLNLEHIRLDGFSRMRVDLAAQVLSETVANAMEHFSIPGAEETIRFIRMFDKAFDCLNVRSLESAKVNRRGYKRSDDERLDWLENDFLGYLEDWEQWVNSREGLTQTEKNSMCLSRETLKGWKITVKSVVEIIRFLLSSSDGEMPSFVLSERFSQDTLENYFGTVRTRGGRSTNPSAKEMLDSSGSIRVQGSQAQAPVRGNSSRPNSRKRLFSNEDIDDTPIPKRSRIAAKK